MQDDAGKVENENSPPPPPLEARFTIKVGKEGGGTQRNVAVSIRHRRDARF